MFVTPFDEFCMRRALELARTGEGFVEPNPMVGAVIAKSGEIIGEGFHAKFGGPHAEVAALADCQLSPKRSTLYVTLEPCRHYGKTPPCTTAILKAGVSRVVVALEDPFKEMRGKGIAELRAAGVEVDVGLFASDARSLLAPYLKRLQTGKPWAIAKWAMSLDGKIAAADRSSKWITGEAARAEVHRLRGRVDGILVGRGTAEADDPSLTARPPGPRQATRVILDRSLRLPLGLNVIQTARRTPTLVVCGPEAPSEQEKRLVDLGVDVLRLTSTEAKEQVGELLTKLGERSWTNLLIEGGAGVLGAFFDAGEIDEVNVYIAGKLIGGESAPSPIGGLGIASISGAIKLDAPEMKQVGPDICVSARVARAGQNASTR